MELFAERACFGRDRTFRLKRLDLHDGAPYPKVVGENIIV